jgi:WD40 repeat protein
MPPTFPGTPPTPTLVRTFANQLAKVQALAFSPDDSLLATASDDGTLYVRRVSDGSEVWHAEGPPPALNGISILAASESNNSVLAFGTKGYAVDLTNDVIRGALDPGPSMIASDTSCVGSRDATAMVCPGTQLVYRDLAGGQVLTGAFTGSGSFTVRGGFALAPDHSLLIESNDNQMNLPASHDASLWTWPLPAGSPAQKLAHPDRLIKRLVYSGDGSTLAGVNTAINDAPIRAWDARTGAQLGQWGLGANLDATTFFTEVAISDAGDIVAAVDNYNPDVAVVRPRAGAVQRFAPTTDDGNSGFRGVAVSPDGTRIAAVSGYESGVPAGVVTHSVTVFTSDGAPVSRVAGYLHLNAFPAAFLTNKTLLRGEHDGTISVWCLP